MADLKEKAISLLSSTTIADMTLDAPTLHALYTCPAGQRCVVDSVVIHSNSATLAGMDDVDFGWGATCTPLEWINNETGIGDMTTAYDYMILRADSDEYAMGDGDAATAADRTFGMYVESGSTGAASAVVDLFGYLV